MNQVQERPKNYALHTEITLEPLQWTETEQERVRVFMATQEEIGFWHFFKFQAGNSVMYTCDTAIGNRAMQGFSLDELLAKLAQFFLAAQHMTEHTTHLGPGIGFRFGHNYLAPIPFD